MGVPKYSIEVIYNGRPTDTIEVRQGKVINSKLLLCCIRSAWDWFPEGEAPFTITIKFPSGKVLHLKHIDKGLSTRTIAISEPDIPEDTIYVKMPVVSRDKFSKRGDCWSARLLFESPVTPGRYELMIEADNPLVGKVEKKVTIEVLPAVEIRYEVIPKVIRPGGKVGVIVVVKSKYATDVMIEVEFAGQRKVMELTDLKPGEVRRLTFEFIAPSGSGEYNVNVRTYLPKY